MECLEVECDLYWIELTDPPQTDPVAPFALSISYPSGASTVQVLRGGKSLVKVQIATSLLYNAITSIPDSGFDKNPSQRLNALLNKISAFDSQLASGDLVGARNKLQNDIAKHLDSWLVDGYATETPLQYTKPQVVALVNELIQRLGG